MQSQPTLIRPSAEARGSAKFLYRRGALLRSAPSSPLPAKIPSTPICRNADEGFAAKLLLKQSECTIHRQKSLTALAAYYYVLILSAIVIIFRSTKELITYVQPRNFLTLKFVVL